MNEALMQLISQTGIWCAAAFVLAKVFLDYINKKDAAQRQDSKEREEVNRQDFKDRDDRTYNMISKLENLMSQQKELLSQQTIMSKQNKDTLDKLTEIQILHTNRLDAIERKQGEMEEQLKKIGSKL